MHVLFIHPSFPAQFGHLARFLTTELKWRCTFLTAANVNPDDLPYQVITYKVSETGLPRGYHSLATLPGLQAHMEAVYDTLRNLPQIQPDLVVGHTTYGTMLLVRNLYRCPFVGYFEYLPPPFWGESFAYRPEFPPIEGGRISNAVYHAFTHLQLHAVDAVYTPTRFQLSTAPKELQGKIKVIHDGVDTDFFQPRTVERPTTIRGLTIDKDTRVVSYVARGLESMRGFDIFMKAAKKISQEMNDVIFLIAGRDRSYYGHELEHLPASWSFKQWVLRQDDYDRSRFHFVDWLSLPELAQLHNLSDLHVYLTVPYILSWSLVQAMASGCTILGSATAPVQEAIEDGVHGLLTDFYDVDGLAHRALEVLKDPGQFKPLGEAAPARVLERYELRKCAGELAAFFQCQTGSLL